MEFRRRPTHAQTPQLRLKTTQFKPQERSGFEDSEDIFIQQICQWDQHLENMILSLTSMTQRFRRQSSKEGVLQRSQSLLQKICLQKSKYQQVIAKVRTKIMNQGGLSALKDYLYRSYTNLSKQVSQITSCDSLNDQNYEDIKRIKNYENEIADLWDTLKDNRSDQSCINEQRQARDIGWNVDGLANQDISKTALEQLHKQFLAIRMISYKMYQKYTEHSHENLHEQLRLRKQEQQWLLKQVSELKLVKIQLQSEQKKISHELAETKRMNQLIGHRYFVENSHVQAHFSTA